MQAVSQFLLFIIENTGNNPQWNHLLKFKLSFDLQFVFLHEIAQCVNIRKRVWTLWLCACGRHGCASIKLVFMQGASRCASTCPAAFYILITGWSFSSAGVRCIVSSTGRFTSCWISESYIKIQLLVEIMSLSDLVLSADWDSIE